MTTVYSLWHVREDDGYGDDAKLIGIYSSEAAANAAIERVADKLGFRGHPTGFQIDRYEVDKDHWTEGFGIAED